jgi:hypothetical protein
MFKIFKDRAQKKEDSFQESASSLSVQDGIKNEEIAAITMGLHLHLNAYRDEESEVITIDMPSAHYSPWALKSLVMKRVIRR